MENKTKFFNKSKKNMTLRQKFDYIKNHKTYYTMNRWSGVESLANNVKIYNLPLTREQQNKFFEIMGDEGTTQAFYSLINFEICEFEQQNKFFEVGFNGRSGGYLVLTPKGKYSSIISEDIDENESYDEMIQYFKEYKGWTHKDAQQEAKRIINEDFEICVLFDNFCDYLLEYLIHILDEIKIEEETITYEKKVKTLIW